MSFSVPSTRQWASSSRSSNTAGSARSTLRQTKRLQQPARRRLLQHCNQRGPATSSPSGFGPHSPDQDRSSTAHLGIGCAPERDADIDEREEDDSLNEVVMAVDLRDGGTVGCAYYIAREEKLYMMQDVISGGIDIVELRERFPDQFCRTLKYYK